MLIELVCFSLLGLATIRSLTTAMRKLVEGRDSYELTWQQRLILKEDTEHWWTAFAMNLLLFSLVVVSMTVPDDGDTISTWQEYYIVYAFIVFFVGLNVRTERHGYYYRRRNGINFWGKSTGESKGDAREKAQNKREAKQDARDDEHVARDKRQDDRSLRQTERGSKQDERGSRQDKAGQGEESEDA